MILKKRIFVTALSFRLPGVSTMDELKKVMGAAKLELSPTLYQVKNSRSASVYNLNLSPETQYYPSRKDVKVMREDVIAATICSQEVMERSGIEMKERSGIALYMSNGACMDELLPNINEISHVYISPEFSEEQGEKHKRVDKVTPPLFVLNALTNSAGSFVSQYAGVRGDNTVYGNTSHSSFDCIEEAINAIADGEDLALVGCANGAGLFTALTFDNLQTVESSEMTLSSGAGFILLESEESMKKRGVKALCEIVSVERAKNIPRLFSISKDPYHFLKPKSAFAIYSGGIGSEDHLIEKKSVASKWRDCFSFYPLFGNTGVAGPLINIFGALVRLEEGEAQVDCINRDPYGRESLIQISQVK